MTYLLFSLLESHQCQMQGQTRRKTKTAYPPPPHTHTHTQMGFGTRTDLSSFCLPPEILYRLQSRDNLLAVIALPVPDEDIDHCN